MAQNSCPEPLSETSGTKRNPNRTLGSTKCGVQQTYVEVDCLNLPYGPYDGGLKVYGWTDEAITTHFELMAGAALAQENQDAKDMRRAADDESTKWTCFSTHYEDCDGQVQFMQGLHIDFQKRVVHECWKSGARPAELEDGLRVQQRNKESY